MKRNSKTYKRLKKWHKWFGIFLAVFIILFSVSGVILNHREFFSSVDINRNFIPGIYRYNNWNLAAVRGNINLTRDTSLVYGNIGIWKVTNDFTKWEDFNRGFPEGIDNRKIGRVIQTPDGRIFAGTFFGLYQWSDDRWEKVPLPVKEERITDLFLQEGSLNVLTRSHLLRAELSKPAFSMEIIRLPKPEDYDNRAGLFKTIWVIHSGEILGISGKLFSDVLAAVFIFLSATGIILWLFPGLIRRLKRRKHKVKKYVSTLRWSLKWHNKLGYYLTILLVLITFTGMFLRPPLLIPIANARIGKIPHTMLDNANPWHDKLRAGIWDENNQRLILSTSEGFYYSDDELQSKLKRFHREPPVSVMGINVLENTGNGGLLVGSFNGLYAWFPDEGFIQNVINGKPFSKLQTGGKPFSANAIAGMIRNGYGQSFLMDYDKGARPFMQNKPMGKMPEQVLKNAPISLWNLALEVHTGRIYSALIGDFYILIIPLAGLSILFLLISGWWMYVKAFKPKTRTTYQKAGRTGPVPAHAFQSGK